MIEEVLAGNPQRIVYTPIRMEEAIGKTIEAIKHEQIDGEYETEDVFRILLTDGTTIAFVVAVED